jgi:Holliday junction resolvase RusA-like endonuclease
MPPISQARARLAGKRFYNAQSQEKMAFGFILKNQHGNEPLFNKAISVDITFYMPQLKNWSAEKRKETIMHSSRPDLDNLEKFLLDAMVNVLITDDNIICSMSAKKVYDSNPRTEFIITEI